MKKEIIAEPIMDEQQMQEYVEQNMDIVPKNQLKKFNNFPLESQVKSIQYYKDIAQMKKDAFEKNRIVNRVKDIFEKRHGTTSDAYDVIKFCQDFIDNFRAREIERLDAEIRRLELMKEAL